MRSSIRKSTYRAIYRLLDRVTPIDGDCGLLCDSACCRSAGADLGIYLLPGEEKVFSRREAWLRWEADDAADYDFPDSWRGKVYFVRCGGPDACVRSRRPLQCRFFPLAPHFTGDGRLVMILFHGELPYTCPLIAKKTDLDPSFIQAAYTVWERLIQDPLIRDLVAYDSTLRDDNAIVIIRP